MYTAGCNNKCYLEANQDDKRLQTLVPNGADNLDQRSWRHNHFTIKLGGVISMGTI